MLNNTSVPEKDRPTPNIFFTQMLNESVHKKGLSVLRKRMKTITIVDIH